MEKYVKELFNEDMGKKMELENDGEGEDKPTYAELIKVIKNLKWNKKPATD